MTRMINKCRRKEKGEEIYFDTWTLLHAVLFLFWFYFGVDSLYYFYLNLFAVAWFYILFTIFYLLLFVRYRFILYFISCSHLLFFVRYRLILYFIRYLFFVPICMLSLDFIFFWCCYWFLHVRYLSLLLFDIVFLFPFLAPFIQFDCLSVVFCSNYEKTISLLLLFFFFFILFLVNTFIISIISISSTRHTYTPLTFILFYIPLVSVHSFAFWKSN